MTILRPEPLPPIPSRNRDAGQLDDFMKRDCQTPSSRGAAVPASESWR